MQGERVPVKPTVTLSPPPSVEEAVDIDMSVVFFTPEMVDVAFPESMMVKLSSLGTPLEIECF